MVNKREEYFFRGEKVLKQTLNKYIAWEKVLSAVKNGADSYELLRERLGKGSGDMIRAIKKAGLLKASSSTRVATYSITEKGVELINDVKQYKKEKKDEERRMLRDC